MTVHSSTPVALWGGVGVVLAACFAIDLRMVARRDDRVSLRVAGMWVGIYVATALAFGAVLLLLHRGQQAAEFAAGYITEYSLSVDNLFVFVLILSRFLVPQTAVEKVLLIGIAGSLVLRAAFIIAGVALLSALSWVFCLFGLLLLVTAWRLVANRDDEGEAEEFRVVGLLRRVLPLSDSYAGDRLHVRHAGRLLWTPLVLAIAAIAIANFVFALDSMPAILGLTQDTFVILTANAFAMLGLRQLFFVIDGLLDRLPYLDAGLALILGFIGLKLVDEGLIESGLRHIGSVTLPRVGIGPSLTFIAVILMGVAAAGWLRRRSLRHPDDDTGSV